jgi:nucleoid DNA-binding protein
MYKVKVQNVCRCFLKSGMAEKLEFQTKEEAKQEAEEMIEKMRSSFCQKHEFSISEQFGDFTIYIKPRS